MGELVDIGGGIKQFVPSTKNQSSLGQISQTLGLINLVNQLQNAPIERELKQLQKQSTNKQLMLNDLQAGRIQQQIRLDEQRARREENKSAREFLTALPALIRANPGAAQLLLQQKGGDLAATQDGTFLVGLPSMKEGKFEFKAFEITPFRVTDPEKKASIEKGFRDEWRKETKNWRVVSSNFDQMKKARLLQSGAGDLAMLRGFFLVSEPNSVVRDGEQTSVENLPSVPQRWINVWNKNLKPKAPFLDDESRQALLDAVDAKVIFERNNVLEAGKTISAGIQDLPGIDLENIISRVGGVGPVEIAEGVAQETITELTAGEKEPLTQPIEAGVAAAFEESKEGRPPRTIPPPEMTDQQIDQEFNSILGGSLFR